MFWRLSFISLPIVCTLVYSSCCCCCCWVASVVSDSMRPRRRQPTRLPRPWDSPGKNMSGLPFPSPMHESEKWKWSHSVVSDSSQPHGLQPTGLLHPWDFPGKSTGVEWHRLLHPGGTSGKEFASQCRKHKWCGFDPWVRKIPWRRKWQPTPRESHGQRGMTAAEMQ